MQTQAYQQVMDEAEKEYKKVSERITESRDAMKVLFPSLSLLNYRLETLLESNGFFFFRLLMKNSW